MRLAPLLCGLTLIAGGNARAADPPPDVRTVVQDEALVRCKPGDGPQVYATNRLRKGATVQVLRALPDGWLEIAPPPGSFSWINRRFVEQVNPSQPTLWAITHPDGRVPVLVGSELIKDHRPTVEGTRLQRGTQVKQFGTALSDSEGTWLSIFPPPSEVRYLRAEAVSKTASASLPGIAADKAVAAMPGVVAAGQTAPAPPPAAPPAPSVDTLWPRAQQAEREGNLALAVQLYEELARAVYATNQPLAVDALNRAQYLRNASRPTAGTPNRPSEARYSTTAAEGRTSPLPTDPGVMPTARLNPPQGPTAVAVRPPSPPPPAADSVPLPSSGPGRLRRAGRNVDYKPTYVLENSQGVPRFYVVPQTGVDLEAYVNRNVEVFGQAVYRGELRANLMTAARVKELP
jgi:hypothetical protein